MMTSVSARPFLNENQFVRCVSLSEQEEGQLRDEAVQKGFYFTKVNLTEIRTKEEMLRRIGQVLGFPSYFGGGWDAFLDMVTDLSWNPAPGYVLLIENAEALLHLPGEQVAIFIRLCAAAVGRWQSGEDENGGVIPRTPFFFLLKGQSAFCRLITDLLTNGRSG